MKKIIVLLVAVFATVALVRAADEPKKEVELQGKMGCGHCTYHHGDSCSVGFKAKDGKIYVLENADDKLMKQRFKGNEIKVKGTVTEKDGELLVKASSVEVVK
jgi:formylmethanofuran dehydrogenase subunit C